MSSKIKIIYKDFEKAEYELRNVQNLLNGYKTELGTNYSTMRKNWKGTASEAFEESCKKIIENFTVNIDNLGNLCSELQKTVQAMKELDEKAASQIKT